MRKVWIAQLKCPSNHAVVALAAEITEDDTAMLEAKLWASFQRLVDKGELDYECGVCKATKLHVEVKRTQFDKLEVAVPALLESERQQFATAEFLRSSRN